MAATHRHLTLLALGIAVTAGIITPLSATGARTSAATLKAIGSRVDDRAGILSIEASDPVPYVASQPDSRTFVVDLRDVSAAGFADKFMPDARNPIASVQVENGRAADGVAVARVRMTLTAPMRPRVRSARNMIYVEAERPERSVVAANAINMAGPSAAIRDVRVTQRGGATAITFVGTGRLLAAGVHESKEGPRRLTLDLPNVTSAVQTTTAVSRGPVDRVRITLSPRAPTVTQVILDMSRQATYRLESSPDQQDLTVVFDEPARDPVAAMQAASRAALLQSAPPSSNPAAVPAAPGGSASFAAPQADAPAAVAPRGQGPTLAAAAPPQAAVAPQGIPASAPGGRMVPGQAPAPAGSQAAAPAPQTAAPATAAPASRYSGHPVSLDFQGADLRAVLRTFAEISGLNIVIDPTIVGTVDVALRDIPWDQALDIILRSNKLGYVVDGTVVRVAPLAVLADEESQRRKLADEQALAGELQVLTRALSYAKATDLGTLIKGTALSSRGSIQTDERTNTIIINDLAERLERASSLIAVLDVPQPQVEIEARIVQTSREFARNLGVQWGVSGRASTALGNTLPLAFPNQGSVTGRTGVGPQGPGAPDPGADSANNLVNLGVQGATTALGLALGSINGALNLDLALSALERQGQGRILSTPRVSTQNNVEAEITQGVQIPIQTVANNTVTVTFRDAALTLKVTPQITAAGTVIMKIAVENASPDFSRQVNNIPPIDTQRANTTVLVSNGDTTVIGGIYVSREQTSQDRTPGLHRLPLLGWLFKRDQLADESRELLIFITPKIMRL